MSPRNNPSLHYEDFESSQPRCENVGLMMVNDITDSSGYEKSSLFNEHRL
jgi:hypothetical protein